jgi:hypothetical protein
MSSDETPDAKAAADQVADAAPGARPSVLSSLHRVDTTMLRLNKYECK